MKRLLLVLWCFIVLTHISCTPSLTSQKETHSQNSGADVGISESLPQIKLSIPSSSDCSDNRSSMPLYVRSIYHIPNDYQCEIRIGDDVSIAVNAIVDVPDITEIPIVEVKKGSFSQTLVYQLFDELCSETPMWQRDRYELTKIQIAKRISSYYDELKQIENDPDEAGYTEYLKGEISSLADRFPNAPLFDTNISCDGTMASIIQETNHWGIPLLSYIGVDARSEENQTPTRFFSVINPNIGEKEDVVGTTIPWRQAHFCFQDWRCRLIGGEQDTRILISDPDNPVELQNIGLENTDFLPAHAVSYTEWFMAKLGIDDIAVNSVIALTNKDNPKKNSYLLLCSRGYRKIPGTYYDAGQRILLADNKVNRWQYESIRICVDEKGIYYISWYSPMEMVRPITNDVTIIDFEPFMQEAMRTIENICFSELNDSAIQINRISFCLNRITFSDIDDIGQLIPAWNFYGTVHKNTPISTDDNDQSLSPLLFSFSAIDGSLIDNSLTN